MFSTIRRICFGPVRNINMQCLFCTSSYSSKPSPPLEESNLTKGLYRERKPLMVNGKKQKIQKQMPSNLSPEMDEFRRSHTLFGKVHRLGNPMSTKQHMLRKQRRGKFRGLDYFTMSAYGMAEEFRLTSLRKDIENHGVYRIVPLPADLNSVILASAKYTISDEAREMYIFENGVVVFWNMTEEEKKLTLRFLNPYRVHPYEYTSILLESEELYYCFTKEPTHLIQEDIHLQEADNVEEEERLKMEKFALSHAMALSVKLGILESDFTRIAADMEPWIVDMKGGGLSLTQSTVLKKTGELFTLRHLINVSTEMVETPDVYWERQDMEGLFNDMKFILSLKPRTNIMNAKLDLCCELTELLSSQLHARHSSRLEWMIIILIMIEVVFETIHYLDRKEDRNEQETSQEDSHVEAKVGPNR